MSEMIERLAAEAFRKAEHLDPSDDGSDDEDGGWSCLPERRKEFWCILVKWIVSEMRKPTATMKTAGLYSKALNEAKMLNIEDVGEVWRAMIDEVLK